MAYQQTLGEFKADFIDWWCILLYQTYYNTHWCINCLPFLKCGPKDTVLAMKNVQRVLLIGTAVFWSGSMNTICIEFCEFCGSFSFCDQTKSVKRHTKTTTWLNIWTLKFRCICIIIYKLRRMITYILDRAFTLRLSLQAPYNLYSVSSVRLESYKTPN